MEPTFLILDKRNWPTSSDDTNSEIEIESFVVNVVDNSDSQISNHLNNLFKIK